MNVTTHMGGVDWNNAKQSWLCHSAKSPPTWVVWIEIYHHLHLMKQIDKSPPTWVVWIEIRCFFSWCIPLYVTTHMGGVDWNLYIKSFFVADGCHHPHGWCGLKCIMVIWILLLIQSPPTWVVWIEISLILLVRKCTIVTTHMGGVDWNLINNIVVTIIIQSPPTRVVWIEIVYGTREQLQVASHHPHGWCGLK